MPAEHMVMIISTARGDDNRLVTYNLSFETQEAADQFIAQLSEAATAGRLVKIAEDERIHQVTFINASHVLEVRRRYKRAGER